MITRPVLQVAGPSGAGKTRFIEHLIQGLPETLLCARCVKEDGIRKPEETRPRDHPELRRYRQAGAEGAALYRFPPRAKHLLDFFDSKLMQDWSDAVVIEGDSPVAHTDLLIFLAPPLPKKAALFIRGPRNRTALEGVLDNPEAFLSGLQGDRFLDTLRQHPEVLQAMRTEISKGARPRKPAEGWALAPGYEGIQKAGLVLVPVHGEEERLGAQRLLAEIPRLRKDPELFRAILGPLGSRVPITAIAVDLSDPRIPASGRP